MNAQDTTITFLPTPPLTMVRGAPEHLRTQLEALYAVTLNGHGTLARSADHILYWIDPETYLVEGPPDLAAIRAKELHPVVVTDQYKRVELHGFACRLIAAKYIDLDLIFGFPVGSATQTRLGDAHVLLSAPAEHQLLLQTRRSYFDHIVSLIFNANRGLQTLPEALLAGQSAPLTSTSTST